MIQASVLPKLKPPVRARQRNAVQEHVMGSSPWTSPSTQRPAPPNQLTKEGLREYQQDLKTYRRLRDSLQSWSDAFMEQHGRRPDRNDIASTHIPWLVRYALSVSCMGRISSLTVHLPNLLDRKLCRVPSAQAQAALRHIRLAWSTCHNCSSGAAKTSCAK